MKGGGAQIVVFEITMITLFWRWGEGSDETKKKITLDYFCFFPRFGEAAAQFSANHLLHNYRLSHSAFNLP